MPIPSVPFAFAIDDPDGSPVSNPDLLDSYVQLGAWLRVIQAYEHITIIDSTDDSARRLASVAGVFSAFGALIEDVTATLASWIAWNRRQHLLLADVLQNVVLTEDKKATPSDEYIEGTVSTLASGKRARIDARVFARALQGLGAVGTLNLLGVPWKSVPSVKVARGDELRFWEQLPKGVDEILTVLSSGASQSVRFSYNKIKHGPQLLVSDLSQLLQRLGRRQHHIQRGIVV